MISPVSHTYRSGSPEQCRGETFELPAPFRAPARVTLLESAVDGCAVNSVGEVRQASTNLDGGFQGRDSDSVSPESGNATPVTMQVSDDAASDPSCGDIPGVCHVSGDGGAGALAGGPVAAAPSLVLDAKRWTSAVTRWQLARDLESRVRGGQTYSQAGDELGLSAPTVCRLLRVLRDNPQATPEAFVDGLDRCGRKSKWDTVLEIPGVADRLRQIHASTIAAASESTTRDRRTASVATTLKLFSVDPDCPPDLRDKLRRGQFPAPLRRFLSRLTPEAEALVRGPKHFTLSGPSGHRDRAIKTIGLPDGTRAEMPANWTVQWDDMSLNQPYWVEGPDGSPILCRQSLISRDVATGRWQTCELVARVRDAYTAADILRTVRRYCELYGVPDEIVFERSVWASRSITGWDVTPAGDWFEQDIARPAMEDSERNHLSQGLRALGIRLTTTYSARGKAHLEGGFNPLQRYLAGFTRNMPNMGRHGGEFEKTATQIRRVRNGVIHPADAGFPHATQLLDAVMRCFDFLNSLPTTRGDCPEDDYAASLQARTSRSLTPMDRAVFLPERSDLTVRGCALWPQRDGREFCFRSDLLAQLGDGYRVAIAWDSTEPSLGAAVYNREAETLRNSAGAAVGQFLGWAAYDVPGPTTRADSVPSGLRTWSTEDLHGAKADGGAALKGQRTAVRGWVKTAFGGQLPGQPRVVAATARNGRGTTAEVTRGPGAGATSSPRTPVSDSPSGADRTARKPWVDPLLAEIAEEEDTP